MRAWLALVLVLVACGVPGSRRCKTDGDCGDGAYCYDNLCFATPDGGEGGGASGSGGGSGGGG